MKITRKSAYTGEVRTQEIDVTPEQLLALEAGLGLIQDIMPNLTSDEREFIMTGIIPAEWDELFPEDCPACGGEGVRTEWGETVTCPACEGSGYNPQRD